MKKAKRYQWVKFTPEVIKEALNKVAEAANSTVAQKTYGYYSITIDAEEWLHDDIDEFFADYRKSYQISSLSMKFGSSQLGLISQPPYARIEVELPTRAKIESIFHIFDAALDRCAIPKPPKAASEPPEPTNIFIGHGRSTQWRELKDHLQDKHKLKVIAYEIGARAGHTIRDILEDMLTESTIAFLVLTGEDEHADGSVHARENVIHELGLFQGQLGFSRAVALLEEGTEEFSNLSGIQQIRFAKDRIRETFGEVVATIKREFGT